MAAATTASAPSIDLRAAGNFPVRLGSSILDPARQSKRYTSVRFNHRPKVPSTQVLDYRITPSGGNSGEHELTFGERREQHAYRGRPSENEGLYVLLCRGGGGERTMVLEKLEASHEFNLVRTPSEDDAAELIERYPQLSLSEEGENDLFGDDDDDDAEDAEQPLDDSNPFDYRHFLNLADDKPKEEAARSNPATPSTQSRPALSNPVPTQTKKRDNGPLVVKNKRKAADGGKANPKRVKAGAEEPASVAPKAPADRQKPPQVRLDRRASGKLPADEDDSGELILENETPVTEKPPRPNAMSLALSGQLGPISLRSAANSPASRMESPMPPRPAGMDEGEEFEIGGSSPGEGSEREDADEGDGRHADDDADFENARPPSPARTHRKAAATPPPAAPSADDEDDLDKQLERAMAEPDDVPALPAESDEESEEE